MKKTTGGQDIKFHSMEKAPLHIPDGKGGSFKTELTVFRSEEETQKYLWWHGDDPRGEPHNHPWDFSSKILHGGYTEDRWELNSSSELIKRTRIYRADGSLDGNENIVPKDTYHIVRDVLKGTVTHLTCGPAREDNEWGYIDIENSEYTRAESDKDFFSELCELNPHLK